MEWNELYNQIYNIKIDFNKSKKALTQNRLIQKITRKNAIVEYLDYQIPVTQLNRYMQAAKRE